MSKPFLQFIFLKCDFFFNTNLNHTANHMPNPNQLWFCGWGILLCGNMFKWITWKQQPSRLIDSLFSIVFLKNYTEPGPKHFEKKKKWSVFNTGDHSIVLVKSKWSCLAWSLTMFRLVWKISVIIIPMWRLLSCLWPSSPHKVYGWSIITGKLQKENNVSTL